MLSLHAKTRPLRPSPLAHCSYNSQQSSPPPSASPSLGWSSSSMASSSSPTRSHHDTHSYETGTLHGGSSPFFTPPWQKEASTPRTTKRAQQYKSTTSSRSHVSTSSSSRSPTPPQLDSGSRWHHQFTQQCKQRAKSARNKAVNERRNGYAGDYVSYERETREELAVLRKMALQDKQRSSHDEKAAQNDMTQVQLDRLYELEAEVEGMRQLSDEQAVWHSEGKLSREARSSSAELELIISV